MLKSELETKEKQCQKLEQEMVNIKKELESCKEDLKLRTKCVRNTNALNDMLIKKKKSKDFIGLGYEAGQCSTSGEI